MKEQICEFASPAYLHGGCIVRPEARKNVKNDKYAPELWKKSNLGSGCTLKVFNDGLQLPIRRYQGDIDITCVGPDDPRCPVKKGFYMGERVKGKNTYPVARQKS